MKMVNVAVIGAGAAGLCAARHIASRSNMKPVVYEQSNSVGGAWKYTEETDRDKNGLKVHSAMYKNLKTNLPKEVMNFPDFPFEDRLPSFLTHEQVQDYLEQYCENFKLHQYIQLETVVKLVKIISSSDGGDIFEVTVKDLKQGHEKTSQFDAVFVCNGHYAEPYIPVIPGREFFRGHIIHSHSYRHPEDFTDKTVVLLGCRSSGQDISLDIAKYAKNVVVSHRQERLKSPLPDNMSQAATISHFERDGRTVAFVDGSTMEADAFVYCTGYDYGFPFLNDSCEIEVDDQRIKHIYEHIVNVSHTSMFFIGICSIICPLVQFDLQVQYSLAVLDGSLKLPSKEEMLIEIEKDYQSRLSMGWPHRAAHRMATLQWRYNDKIADIAKISRLNPRIEKLYDDVGDTRKVMLGDYKKNSIKLLENGDYEVLVPK